MVAQQFGESCRRPQVRTAGPELDGDLDRSPELSLGPVGITGGSKDQAAHERQGDLRDPFLAGRQPVLDLVEHLSSGVEPAIARRSISANAVRIHVKKASVPSSIQPARPALISASPLSKSPDLARPSPAWRRAAAR